MLREAINAKLDLDEDLQPIFDLMQLCGITTTNEISLVQQKYHAEIDRQLQVVDSELRSRLASRHDIRGDAVVANIDQDPTWKKKQAGIKTHFEQKLQVLTAG